MLEELRLNPRSPRAPFKDRRPGESAAADDGAVDTNLSTGFTARARRRSTAAEGSIHAVVAAIKEEVE